MTDYINPIVKNRADPWVYKHTDGYYYFTGSVPGFQEIELRRSKTLEGLNKGEIKTIWRAHDDGVMSELIWAPEVHFIEGKWYIYFAASDHAIIRDEVYHHRMFVIECLADDPFEGEWVEKGQIKTHLDTFSLDGTTFEHQNQRYYVWAQQDPAIAGNSNLYIAKMKTPWELEGEITLLAIPEFDWEKIGFLVNEGPAVIVRNDKVILAYSASATDENYAMGILWADRESDLMNPQSWTKIEEAVFKSSKEAGKFGPGHNSFTRSEDDQEDVLIYHARPEINKFGDPLNNPDRHANAQVFNWGEDGLPYFGQPI